MKCSKFRKIAVPLLMESGGEEELALLLARRDARLREHMDSCYACRGYLGSCREALGRLGRTDIEEPSPGEWAGMLDTIHGAARGRAPVYRVLWGDQAYVSWARVGVVAAVALLLCIGSRVYFRPPPDREGYVVAPRPAGLRPAGAAELAFLDELETEDKECSELISEIDELIEEIDSAYAQLGAETDEISLEYGVSDGLLT